MRNRKLPLKKEPRMSARDRREQLLRAAIDTFARQGFAGTKTRDIAAAAGVSEAILFRHFSTKEELYHAILDMKGSAADAGKLAGEMQQLADLKDDRGLFCHFGNAVLGSFRRDPAFQRLMTYASLEGHLIASLFLERFTPPFHKFFKRYILSRQKDGAFVQCDPDLMEMFAVGTFTHYGMRRYVFGAKESRTSDAEALKELVDLILCGLRGDTKHD